MNKFFLSFLIGMVVMAGGEMIMKREVKAKGLIKTESRVEVNDNLINWGDWEAPVLGEKFWWEDELGQTVECGAITNATKIKPRWQIATDNQSSELKYEWQISENRSGIASTEITETNGLDEVNEEGQYNFSLVVSDESLNATRGADLCEVIVDRTAPSSWISGNGPLIASEAAVISYLVYDENSLIDQIELYYRWQATNKEWQGDFELAAIKKIEAGAEVGSFELQKSSLKGEGYYQFWTIAIDRAGNKESWPAEPAILPVSYWIMPVIKREQAVINFENALGKFDYTQGLRLENLDFSGAVVNDQELETWWEQMNEREDFLDYYWLVNKEIGASIITENERKILKLENNTIPPIYNGFSTPQAAYHLGQWQQDIINNFHTLSLKYKMRSEIRLPGIHDGILNIKLCGVNVAQVGAEQLKAQRNDQGWYESDWQELKLNGLHCQRDNMYDGNLIFNLGTNLSVDEKFEVYIDEISFKRNLINAETDIVIESREKSWPLITYEYWQDGELLSFQASEVARFKLTQSPDDNLVTYYLGNQQQPKQAKEQLWIEIDRESPKIETSAFEIRSDLRAGTDPTWRWDLFWHFLTGDNYLIQPLIYRVKYLMTTDLENQRPETMVAAETKQIFTQKTVHQSLDQVWRGPSMFGDQHGEDYYSHEASPYFKTTPDYAWLQVYDQALNSQPDKTGILINLKTGKAENYDERF